MKALSIRQPWAWMILHAGKSIENRTWQTSYRGPLLIHAGTRDDPSGWAVIDELEAGGLTIPEEFHAGGIVGMVDMVEIVTHSDSPWFIGPYGWVLANPREVELYRCPGRLGLFDVDYPPV